MELYIGTIFLDNAISGLVSRMRASSRNFKTKKQVIIFDKHCLNEHGVFWGSLFFRETHVRPMLFTLFLLAFPIHEKEHIIVGPTDRLSNARKRTFHGRKLMQHIFTDHLGYVHAIDWWFQAFGHKP